MELYMMRDCDLGAWRGYNF